MKDTWLRWILPLGLTACVAIGCTTPESSAEEAEDTDVTQQAVDLPGYDIANSPATVEQGAAVSVDFVAPTGHATTDWLGIFPVGGQNYELLAWTYAPASDTGTVELELPQSAVIGQLYEVRYNLDNGYETAATSDSFEAVAPTASPYSFSAVPSFPSPGSSMSVSWAGPANHSTVDWIGLYSVGAGINYIDWAYVDAPGATSGAVNITLPGSALPGEQFEFRYNLNNGYEVAATSVIISAGNSISAPVGPVAPGDFVVSNWGAPASHSALDWIGLFQVGVADNAFEAYAYVGSEGLSSGSVSMQLPANAAEGQQYELRYFLNNTYQLAGRSSSFAAGQPPVGYTLSGPVGPVAADQYVDGSWTGPTSHSATDWIGLYEVGAPYYAPQSFAYVGAAGDGGGVTQVLIPAGTTPGSYELRYNTNNTYTVVASSAAFQVE